MPSLAKVLAGLLILAVPNCGGSPAGPDGPNRPVHVFFVGNSLTYTESIQSLVQALADQGGQRMSHTAFLQPNYALEDHWNDGLAGEIQRLKPDIIVLQQGPSSLPDSRVNLVYWTEKIDSVVRLVGGRSALYMVWPPSSSADAFPAVRDSYAAAADAVQGMLLPAGVTWLEIWKQDAALELYGKDGFHPSYLGALAAAETIYAVLFDVEADRIPRLEDGLAPGVRDIVTRGVARSVATWGRR
jgi:hypothetical protein